MTLYLNNSKGYALFLAILPVILMYRMPGIGLSLTTCLIAVGMVYALMVILKNCENIQITLITPFALYLVYVMTKSTEKNMLLMIAILTHVVAISTGAVNVSFLRRTIECIATIAAVLLIVQFIVHFVTGVHIPMINCEWMIDSLSNYKSEILTGIASNEGMYRPSAIFLEPAHFSQYCIIGIGSLLFCEIPKLKSAILISISIFLTTSGMGFVLVFAMWVWWYIARNKMEPIQRKIIRTMIALFLICLSLLIMNQIPYFHSIISRFISTQNEKGGYNAINGRTFWWETYFGGLSLKDLLWGFGEVNLPDNYFTGFMEQLYAYGIIGFTLFVISLVNLIKKGNMLSNTITIMYLAMMFIANLTGFISIIFYVGTIISILTPENEYKCNKQRMNLYLK